MMHGEASKRRSGQTLGVVFLLLSFLAVLAYAVRQVMLDFHAQAHRLTLGTGVQNLALSGLAAGSARLRAAAVPGTRWWDDLVAGTRAAGPLDLDISTEVNLLLIDYPGATLSVRAVLGAPRTLAGEDPGDPAERARLAAGRGWDPGEQRFPVQLSAEARWGAVRQELTVVRELAVVHLAPGSLGKFTLWAAKVTPANADGFACGFDGAPATGGTAEPRPPLVLHNEGAAPAEPFSRDPEVYRKRGWVWLGGDPSLTLSSGYLGAGELWTFLPIEELSALVLEATGGAAARSAAPVYVDSDPPDFFLRTYAQPGSSIFQRFDIRHMISGFFAGADDRGRKLADLFPEDAKAAGPAFGNSSRLHLYGTAETPSPTLVLGRVQRRYATLSAVLVDSGDDGTADAIVSFLPRLAETFPAGLPALPPSVPALVGGAAIPIDTEVEVTWPNMFAADVYPTFASQLEERPYMEAYDFLYRADDGTASFHPAAPHFNGFVEEAVLGEPTAPFYRGNPEGIDARALLEKATYRVATAADLEGRFLRTAADGSSELSLGAVVEVASTTGGVCRLARTRVRRGGMLILSGPGDLELSDLTFDDALDAPLIVVALAGNVRIRSDRAPTSPLPVAVIAPVGRLEMDAAIALEGALAVGTLDLEKLPQGGNLYHDRRLDPLGALRREQYRVLMSDAALRW